MGSAYFASLVTKPIIVTGPGQYRTRCGQIVTVDRATMRHEFGCTGSYPNGTREAWHRSGRVLATSETINDIIGPA